MKTHQIIYIILSAAIAIAIFGGILACALIQEKNTNEIEALEKEIEAIEKELNHKDQLLSELRNQAPSTETEPEEETTPDELRQEQAPEQEQSPAESPETEVAGAQKQYFLTDFDNYAPESAEIRISRQEAEQIAQIGFEESKRRIAGEGADNIDSQKMEFKTICANNYFTRKGTEYDRVYNAISRQCYVFTRTNEMGCGISIYVDATTGLIIGGTAFGD